MFSFTTAFDLAAADAAVEQLAATGATNAMIWFTIVGVGLLAASGFVFLAQRHRKQ